MSHENYAGLSGPDFLKAIANVEEVSGNLINAAEFRRRARDWQRDIASATTTAPVARQRRPVREVAEVFRT